MVDGCVLGDAAVPVGGSTPPEAPRTAVESSVDGDALVVDAQSDCADRTDSCPSAATACSAGIAATAAAHNAASTTRGAVRPPPIRRCTARTATPVTIASVPNNTMGRAELPDTGRS